jgi:hypothetical protein
MTDLTIEQRVAAGVAWLDANKPGWAGRIDLGALNMRSPHRCVLGQLFGNYWQAPEDLHGDAGMRMGFESVIPVAEFVVDFKLLGDEWTKVITSRREAVVSDAR